MAAKKAALTATELRETHGAYRQLGPEWSRLRDELIARRDVLDWRQRDVADQAGVSFNSYTPLETLKQKYEPSKRILSKVSAAIGWTPDSAQRILAGGEPVVAKDEAEMAALKPAVGGRPVVSLDAFSRDLRLLQEADPEMYEAIRLQAARAAELARRNQQ